MTAPRLVVLCGVYNEAQYLDDTLPTILGQSVRDIAVFLTDNGSTDETPAILARYAAADPRITLRSTPTNLRPPVSSNLAWRRVLEIYPDAPWYLSHGADDRMADGYLQAILDAAARHPTANVVFSPWRWIDHPEKRVKVFPRFDSATCHEQHQMPAWKAITRELWDAVGGEDEAVPIASDWDWIVRARDLMRPVQLDRPYLELRVREGEGARMSQTDEVVWRDLYRHLCRVTGRPIAGWAC